MKPSVKKYIYLTFSIFTATVLSIAFFFMLYKIKSVAVAVETVKNLLMPFIYGGVIAYLLTPLCNLIEKNLSKLFNSALTDGIKAEKWARRIAIAIAFIIATVVLGIFFRMVLPHVIESVIAIAKTLPVWIMNIAAEVETFLLANPQINEPLLEIYDSAYESLRSFLDQENILQNIVSAATHLTSGVSVVIAAFKNVFIGLIAAMYMLATRRKFRAQGKKIVYGLFSPEHANEITEEFRFANKTFLSFICGKLLDSAIIGVLAFAVLNIMKMPYVVLLSVIIGVTNIIPFFGPFIGAIPCAIIVLMVNPLQCVYFIIFIFLLQQFDGNILGPKILGDSTGVSSFWVLFSILLFGGLWGFVGMIIAVPLFAVIYDIISKYINYRLKKKDLSTETEDYLNLKRVEYGNLINHKK